MAVTLEPVFLGITPEGSRRALRRYLKDKYTSFDKFLDPCAGMFAIAEIYADLGIPPEQIHTSDFSFFSATLGYLFDPTKKVSDLGLTITSSELIELTCPYPHATDLELAAKTLLFLKYNQLSSKSEYIQWQKKQYMEDSEKIYNTFLEGLSVMKDKLEGLHHDVRNGHDLLIEQYDNPKAFIWYSPPTYKGGYTKMFKEEGFEWDSPEVPELTLEDISEFMLGLDDRAARIAIYAGEGRPFPVLDSPKWHKMFMELLGRQKRRVYILLNEKPKEVYEVKGAKVHKGKIKPPAIYKEQEITSDSVLSFVPVKEDMALYFYDLFAKELGLIKAENYYLFCIDGKVAGVIGYYLREAMLSRKGMVHLSFGLSLFSKRYTRLGRLMLRLAVGREFITRLCKDAMADSGFYPYIDVIQTTCMSKYPESKKHRGIMKLKERILKEEDMGKYRLVYQSAPHDLTTTEVLADWLDKHSSYRDTNYKEVSYDVAN